MLKTLDDFEGHPDYYTRIQVPVISLQDSTQYNPWTYFLIDFSPKLLTLPFIEDYKSRGDHGLRYVERWEREEINFSDTNMRTDIKMS